jgi:hypothetical protein
MVTPEMALFIGEFSGLMLGLAVGFLVARMIYRSPNWPADG